LSLESLLRLRTIVLLGVLSKTFFEERVRFELGRRYDRGGINGSVKIRLHGKNLKHDVEIIIIE
jgi:hypothetical protein